MRRLIVLLVVALIAGLAAPTAGATATTRKYSTCAKVNADYPAGVAKTAAAATAVMAAGFQRPTVNRRLYTAITKATPRLDRPRNGVVCEVRIVITVPSAVQGLTVTSTSQTEVVLVWSAPADLGNGTIVRYDVTGSGVITLSGTAAIISGLTAGTGYQFAVVAVNEAGAGTSSTVGATTTTPPAPTPSPTPMPSAAPPAAVRYQNCTAARAAGVTPIRAPSALYDANRHLDRDGDGVACE